MPLRSIRLRYPYEVYLLTLAMFSSVPASFGKARAAPGSVVAHMQPYQVRMWAISLSLGGLLALIGIFWPQKNAKAQATGLTLEQTGLVICGFAGLVYAWTIYATVGLRGLVPMAFVLGFSAASFAQARMIHNAVERALKLREARETAGQ